MTNETLPPATKTTDGQQDAPPVTAGSSPTGTNPQQAAPEATPKQGETEKPKEPPKDAPKGPPEKYELKAEKVVGLDGQFEQAFAEIARASGWTQEAAQKNFETVANVIRERHLEFIEKQRKEWVEAARADKEIGGDNLTATQAMAAKGLDAMNPKLRGLLKDSGWDNHPEMLRAWAAVGKAISPDAKLVQGGAGGGTKSLSNDEKFERVYGKQRS